MKTRRLTPLLLTALLSCALPLASPAQQDASPLPGGTKAPAFVTKTVDGKTLSLKSLRGKVVLLDYWATWCGPCQMAIPTLQSLHEKYGRRGLAVVGLSIDAPSSVAQVKPFIKHFGMTYSVAAVPKANGQAAAAYHVQGIPAQFLIDKRGFVRWSISGYYPDEKQGLSKMIEQLLAEKA